VRAGLADSSPGGLPFVTSEIVEDADVAFSEGWDQNLLDIEREELTVSECSRLT
jgi:hypothetical protein